MRTISLPSAGFLGKLVWILAWLLCTTISTTGYAADNALVGVLVPRTPPGSVIQGTQILQGIELAAKIVNERGGLLGRPIQLVVEDDQGLPERGRAAAEKLITKDRVIALTGIQSSSIALQILPLLRQHNIAAINTNGWSDEIRTAGAKQMFNPNMYLARTTRVTVDTIKGLGAKSVVLFNENTDYGIQQGLQVQTLLRQEAPAIKLDLITLDRAGKDYMPAIIPLRTNRPDLVVSAMLAPAAYLLLNQLYEQGVAHSAKTVFFDSSGFGDNPDFWQNVGDAGQYMVTMGLYHPSMTLPAQGQAFAERWRKDFPQTDLSRLHLQGADSVFLLEAAAKKAGTLESEKLQTSLRELSFEGARGTISFSSEPGWKFQQWIDIPYVIYQFTKPKQRAADAPIVQDIGQALNPSKVAKPAR
jgi:branched-chain amino acid transport system substrate-binding protein